MRDDGEFKLFKMKIVGFVLFKQKKGIERQYMKKLQQCRKTLGGKAREEAIAKACIFLLHLELGGTTHLWVYFHKG